MLGCYWSGHYLVPYLLLFYEHINKIGWPRQIGWRQHKDSKLQGYASVGKRKLVGNVDNVASYIMAHNSINVLCKESLSLSVIEGVRLIGEEAKGHARRHLKMIRESINPTFYA